jgi:hypothetical protein
VSKGHERKKETKKNPARSLMENRAAKAEKRNQKKKQHQPAVYVQHLTAD